MEFLFLLPLLLFPLVILIRWQHRRLRNLPPGPPGLPIIGNIFQIGDSPQRALADLAKIYGPLMYLKMGFVDTIVISSPEIAKEVLQTYDHLLANRPHLAFGRAHDHNEKSVIWMNEVAKLNTQKKFCKEHLFSLPKLDESKIIRSKKIEDMRDYLYKCCEAGTVVNIGEVAFTTSLNMISSTFFSTDFAAFDSGKSREFREIATEILKLMSYFNLADYFSFLKPFDPQGIQHKTAIYYDKLFVIFNQLIDERVKSKTPESDFLQALLKVSDTESSDFTRDDILHLLMDLFIAGTATTLASVEWAMAELLHNPSKMVIAKNELKDVLENKMHVEEADTLKLPYLQAVVKETLRLHPVAPFLVPRQASVDVEINGYTIPKDAHILVNIWPFGRNDSLWEDSESFTPERFLDNKIDLKGQNFELIPFGSGRRMCLGIPLALRVVHLLVASMIHNIDWELENGTPPEKMDMNDRYNLSLQKLVPLRAIPSRPHESEI